MAAAIPLNLVPQDNVVWRLGFLAARPLLGLAPPEARGLAGEVGGGHEPALGARPNGYGTSVNFEDIARPQV